MPHPLSQPRPRRRFGLQTRDFDRVYRRPARRQQTRRFLVVARRNELGETRWGLSVKAQLGGAVVRNRVKRRLREILRRAQRRLPVGWDVVVQPRASDTATADFATLTHELEALLEKALRAEEGA